MFNLSGFGTIFNLLYTDRLSVLRQTKVKEGSLTTLELRAIPEVSDIPCRVSLVEYDNSRKDLEDRNPTSEFIKIFCAPNIPIQKGDYLVVKRLNDDGSTANLYTAYAGKPMLYPTHQQIMMVDEGNA